MTTPTQPDAVLLGMCDEIARLRAANAALTEASRNVLAWWNKWASEQAGADDEIERAEWDEFRALRAALASVEPT